MITKRIDVEALPPVIGTLYPSPLDEPCRTRRRTRIGNAAGLTQFGVNFVRLPPGAWSSQRHWHTETDELVYVLSGELVLLTEGAEEILRAGEAAGFKANDPNGHHLQNRSSEDATFLEIGTRVAGDAATYPDVDLVSPPHQQPALYTHRDGTPYPKRERSGPGTT